MGPVTTGQDLASLSDRTARKRESRARDFLIGVTILLVALVSSVKVAFNSSALAEGRRLVQDESLPALTFLVTVVFGASIVNGVTHIAVVLNLLDDALVLSILVGVGFDVASQVLSSGMWTLLFLLEFVPSWRGLLSSNGNSSQDFSAVDVALLVMLALSYSYQLTMHVRALFLSASFERLVTVVKSAQNNLVGDPGPAYRDHIFAFVDTAFHMFQVACTGWMLGMAGMAGAARGLTRALMVVGSASCILTLRPSERKDVGAHEASIASGKGGRLVCRCCSCKDSYKGSVAFSVDIWQGQLCHLWFLTFRQLLGLVESMKNGTVTECANSRQSVVLMKQ
mmetsp:Transcript_53041/g.158740  ORF Transcript_53041/g.158740 Transcript_53041/m.158740 type:complete len:339 (-) Transcript_53041:473-1489(-)